ncbi:MAG TPA: hypothetical protein VD836_14825, partial [Solirubrobacteraceae bacterium]|nr:hypothetical protein [Solirubrobacteraceae bacterium]
MKALALGGGLRSAGRWGWALALLLAVLALVVPATAAADWRSDLGATASDQRRATAAEFKRAIDEPLRPLAAEPLTVAALDAVAADAAHNYAEGDRPRSRA